MLLTLGFYFLFCSLITSKVISPSVSDLKCFCFPFLCLTWKIFVFPLLRLTCKFIYPSLSHVKGFYSPLLRLTWFLFNFPFLFFYFILFSLSVSDLKGLCFPLLAVQKFKDGLSRVMLHLHQVVSEVDHDLPVNTQGIRCNSQSAISIVKETTNSYANNT